MVNLTDFQKRVLHSLSEFFDHDRIVYDISFDGGPRDFAAVVRALQYVLWIYPDEANVEGPNLDERFEKYDYSSAEDLASSYIDHVKGLIKIA